MISQRPVITRDFPSVEGPREILWDDRPEGNPKGLKTEGRPEVHPESYCSRDGICIPTRPRRIRVTFYHSTKISPTAVSIYNGFVNNNNTKKNKKIKIKKIKQRHF